VGSVAGSTDGFRSPSATDDLLGLCLPNYRRSGTAACHASSEPRQQRAITVDLDGSMVRELRRIWIFLERPGGSRKGTSRRPFGRSLAPILSASARAARRKAGRIALAVGEASRRRPRSVGRVRWFWTSTLWPPGARLLRSHRCRRPPRSRTRLHGRPGAGSHVRVGHCVGEVRSCDSGGNDRHP
jgi:hypothetical protein